MTGSRTLFPIIPVRSTDPRWKWSLIFVKVDGLRIDSVMEVQKDFWAGFEAAAGVYCVGEVDNGDPTLVCPYQEVMDGVLDYPMYVNHS